MICTQDNILVSDDGVPKLTDFGVSRLLLNTATMTGTSNLKGSIRWMAPELVHVEIDDGDDGDSKPSGNTENRHEFHTKATDVWAFGMVVYVRSFHAFRCMPSKIRLITS
jgi:serine/threonine protein kinase